MIAEGKSRVNKVEEDNAKLRRALEQSMTRLNRMSLDSDYFVDRLAFMNFIFSNRYNWVFSHLYCVVEGRSTLHYLLYLSTL